MQTLDQTNESGADLYWLTFLLTGDREASLDVTLEALGFAQGANPFFSTWMLAWSRRVVIAKALAVIRDELATSAHRTASKRAEESTLPPRNWDPDQDATKVVLERALLAIDVFPRCALLLSVFERMPVEDVANLLDSDRDLVRKAQLTGLRALTRNLARMQGWRSTANRSYVITSELQDA
jgi:DNA-directed RNA polymerase specialized sigma24 family protein